MLSTTLVSLILLSFARAAPALTLRDIQTTKWTPEHSLRPHEVVMFGQDSRMEVVHKADYEALLLSMNIRTNASEIDETFQEISVGNVPIINLTDSGLHSRQFSCSTTTVAVVDKTYDFVGWDIQMSPVADAGENPSDITVYSGYTTTNTVQGTGSIDTKWLSSVLGDKFGINYSRSWATTTQITIKGTVSANNHGVMRTEPLKTRRIGRVLQGCPGSFQQVGTFQADNHKTGQWKGIDWVSGAVGVCQKRQFPLTFCNGRGTFV